MYLPGKNTFKMWLVFQKAHYLYLNRHTEIIHMECKYICTYIPKENRVCGIAIV